MAVGLRFPPRRCYNLLRAPPAIREFFLRKLKLPLLLFWGKWGTFMPLEGRVPLMAVYGVPIEARRRRNAARRALPYHCRATCRPGHPSQYTLSEAARTPILSGRVEICMRSEVPKLFLPAGNCTGAKG